MKIALLIQHADRRRGGAEAYTMDLARALAARSHTVTLVAEDGPATAIEDSRAAGYECLFLGSKGRTRWPRLQDFLRRLKDHGDTHAYDIVHAMLPVWRCDVYQPHSGLANDALLSGHLKHPQRWLQRASRLANRINAKRRGLARIERAMLESKAPPYLFCFSSMMREFALRHFAMPEGHLVTLMNGINLARFDPRHFSQSRNALRAEWKIGKDQCLGLFVGNNWKLKGVQDAIDALGQLGDKRLSLLIAGRDDPAPYRKKATALGVARQVLFAGSVSDPRPLYGAADFLLLPTRRDTCSLVVFEALAMGLPVITTHQNGAAEAIAPGKQGILIDRGDPKTLAAAMRTMLDARQRRAMAQYALAIRESLSLDTHINRIEGLYREIVDRRQVAHLSAANSRS